MPRLFAAIVLPEDIRWELSRSRMPLPGAKWVEPENMHITLRFAGDITSLEARDFADALSQISLPAFEITIGDLGVFGGNDPRVLWAGAMGGAPLERLSRACERSARIAGLPPEGRAFKPHVTLARLRHSRADALARFLARRPNVQFPPFIADHFVLYSSKPKVGGGPYVIEEVFPLMTPWVGEVGEWDPA